jgi:hypothetical protein
MGAHDAREQRDVAESRRANRGRLDARQIMRHRRDQRGQLRSVELLVAGQKQEARVVACVFVPLVWQNLL